MAGLKIKDSDSVKVLTEYLESDEACNEAVEFIKKYTDTTVKDLVKRMVLAGEGELSGWTVWWLTKHYLVLTPTTRINLIKYIAQYSNDVNLMKLFKVNRNNLTKREFALYKKLLEGKLPNIEEKGDFDG